MITMRHMRFYSPDGGDGGGAGGGTAVLDAPAPSTSPAVTPEPAPLPDMGAAYRASLDEQSGKTAPVVAKEPASREPEPAKPPETPKAKRGATKAKPASALDAVLESEPALAPSTEDKKPDEAPKSFLADLPEQITKDKQSENWGKARDAIKHLETERGELQTKLVDKERQLASQHTPSQELNDEVARLNKRLKEYEDALVGINVDYHPDHRRKFIDGRRELVDRAAQKASAYGADGKKIVQAMGEPEGRMRSDMLEEALGDMKPIERDRVMAFILDAVKLDDERAELQKDPQGAWNKLQTSERERIREAQEQAENFKKSTFEGALRDMPSRYFLMRTVDPTIPGADEHNSFVESVKANAFKLLGPDATPQELVEASIKSQMVDRLQKHLSDSRGEVKTLLARLADYEGAEPGFRGGTAPKKDAREALLDQSPGDIYNSTLRKMQGGE